MSRDLLDLVRELNTLNDDNLADRVIENSDVQWCLSELQDILEEMPTLTPPNEWVSVEDRLPPPNVRVLAYRPGEGDNSPYKYTNMWGWAVKESIRHKGITHWMYYPAPPDRRPPEGEA